MTSTSVKVANWKNILRNKEIWDNCSDSLWLWHLLNCRHALHRKRPNYTTLPNHDSTMWVFFWKGFQNSSINGGWSSLVSFWHSRRVKHKTWDGPGFIEFFAQIKLLVSILCIVFGVCHCWQFFCWSFCQQWDLNLFLWISNLIPAAQNTLISDSLLYV